MNLKHLLGAALFALASIPAALGAQATYTVPSAGPMSMSTFVTDYLNPSLAAILSNNSGATAPAVSGQPGAYQWWVDTSASPRLLKIYDGMSWLTLASIDTTGHVLTVNSSALSGLGTGVLTWMQTPSSANLAAALTDETGSGVTVFATSPSLTTPTLGVASASSVAATSSTASGNGMFLPAASTLGWSIGGTGETRLTSSAFSPNTSDSNALGTTALMWSDLFLASGGVINFNNGNATLTHSAGLLTSNVPISLGTSNALTAGTVELGAASDTTLARSAAGVVSIEGSDVLTTATGQALDSDLTSWAAITRASGFDTFATTPSSANLAALLTDETGTGAAVLATSPALTTPNLGTPSAATLTNATGLPVATGISGLGTGVASALATNVGSAGAPVVLNGAGGTPSSITLTNGTALPMSGLTASTSTAIGVGSVNLGHASDTTIARVSAGVASIEGVTILTTATGQPLDSDLTTVAGLTATTDNILQSVGSAWASRTPAQVTATLPACIGDAGSGGTKGLVPAPATGDATKFLRGDCTFVAIPGGGDALVANPLSQFAATTSAQLAGVISDETGSGANVFADGPTLTTPVLGVASATSVDIGNADTTLSRASAGNLSVEGNAIYRAGGTDVAMADGGTGASLTDPNADRILFWDDSAGANTWLTPSASLVINGTTLAALEVWGGAVSDETTAITTGTAKLSFSIPYAFTVVGVYCTLNTVSSSGTPTFDINEAGVSIISTKVVIDASEYTGGSSGYQGTAAGAAVISDSSIAAFAQITVDIDTAGTGTKGAKCMMIGYR